MSPAHAIVSATVLIVSAMALFYYLPHTWIVRGLGAIGVLLFLVSFWQMNMVMVKNRAAFGSTEFATFPMLEQRKLLALFRLHAESAEDRVFSVLNNYFALILLLSLTIQPWWLCVAAPLHAFGNFYALRRSWPGYALILGASNDGSTKSLAITVQRTVNPLFTTNLLNFVTHSEIEHEMFKATSYRLKNEVISWKSAVEVHAAFARVIVLDLTVMTEGVRDELDLIFDCGFWYKTLFLCPSAESTSTLSRYLSRRPECLVVADHQEVGKTLQALLKQFPIAPTSERCLKQLTDSARS